MFNDKNQEKYFRSFKEVLSLIMIDFITKLQNNSLWTKDDSCAVKGRHR